MQLFRMTYNRQGHKDAKSMTLCKTGIVTATELAYKLAQSWHLTNWELQKVPFAKHTRRVLPTKWDRPSDQQELQ